MHRFTRRDVVTTGTAAALAGPATAQQILNDAGRMSPTPITRRVRARASASDYDVLRAMLKQAIQDGRPVVAAGARHSMGGQSLARDGVSVSFDPGKIETDKAAGLYRVSSGALWRDVISALDPHGLSPKVLQANNDFSVGGTFSVNAHGWAIPFGPMGSTVQSFRLMTWDGMVRDVARGEPLFGLVMGGYGLMGLILDLTIEAVPNYVLEPEFETMPAERFSARFLSAMAGPGSARMGYGRLSVAREGFLEEAALVTFRGSRHAAAGQAGKDRATAFSTLTRTIYRRQIGSDAMKRARWYAETEVAPRLQPQTVARNALLNTSASLLEERSSGRTDILHEYFLPPARLHEFLAACRRIIPPSGQELLNVTLRFVGEDDQSVLAFAPTRRIAAVMSFSQLRTAAADDSMRRLTQALVEAALSVGGSYYLPYRLHARRDQFERTYPRSAEFAAAKRALDTRTVFRNGLWDRYLA